MAEPVKRIALSPEVHRAMKAEAAWCGTTMQQLIEKWLSERLDAENAAREDIRRMAAEAS